MKIVKSTKFIPAEEIEITRYVADDGKSFFSKVLCLEHERYVERERIEKGIKHINHGFDETYCDWYVPQNEEQLEWIKKHSGREDVQMDEWYSWEWDEYDNKTHSISLSEYVKDFADFIKEFDK